MTLSEESPVLDAGRAPAPAPAPEGRRVPLWLAIVACSVPMFMVALDNLVVSTALHTLAVDLKANTQELQWFVNAYVLSFACLLMTGAALGDRFGRRAVFVVGIVVFTLASIGCGLSDTSAQLITFRTIQGFGAAAVMPLSLTLLSQAVPERLRGMALGVWSGVSGLAVAMGPVVGGAVVDGLDWQWIFWINVPVCVVAIPLVLFALRESSLPGVRLDLVGMLLAAAGLCAVVWAIVHGEPDGWTSGKVLGAFAAGTVLLALFVAWEARTDEPMLPLSFYRVRAFTLTNVVSATMYFGVFGSLFLLAQYLQIVPPRTPLEAGVRTLAWTLMPMFVAPVAGLLTDKVGGGRLMALGLFLQGVGLGWINLVADTDTAYSSLVGPMIVAGIGMGFVFAPTAAVVLGSVAKEHAGKASGANTTVREIGGALGIAVLSTVFVAHGSTRDPQRFVDGLHPAVWVGVAVVLAGAVCALGIPRRPRPADQPS
ncbi:MFS transporter [Streptomyces longwoodensis]|uniref:MFS transporter n=1 Tax=Streptomyces lasalocidi TaxID=324833 RepID=A0A4V6AVD2_STRLS|nr:MULTISPECIES: MFS transporter [Streptomyces]TKS99392.1 MFS transporter [Streptomyces lasalocidi]WRY87054.1 MFS transporter [Streptomyces longwoodensis]WTI48560.1 MFS transporter [Streptomyces longwoodensis]WUC61290.1 MFS transporter [Streptomyces longwoodensis]